ncbi:MAG: histidine triad nucleotide-binding protein [Bradymonadales bacterium]
MSEQDNIFRKIIRGEADAEIVYEDHEMLAFRDIFPAAPLHILLIPRKAIDSLADTTPDDEGLLGRMLLRIAALAREFGVSEAGYRTVINTNAAGGQTVSQLHIHLLAERDLTWPPG